MAINEKDYLREIKNRVEYYVFLSKKPDVVFKKLKVYKHPDEPKNHFIHLEYVLKDEKDKKTISTHEEVETFVRARAKNERGWLRIFNREDHAEQIKEFLETATLANIKTDHVKLGNHDNKSKV